MKLNDIQDLQLINCEEGSRKLFSFRPATFFDFALLRCKGSSALTTYILNNNKTIRKSKETSENEIKTNLKNIHEFN